MTPFAARALDRGLTGLLITLRPSAAASWNPNRAAQGIDTSDPIFNSIVDDLARRAEEVSGRSVTWNAGARDGPDTPR